ATHAPSRPSDNFLVILMACFLHSGCPNWTGSRRPVTVTPNVGATAWMQLVLRRETRTPLHSRGARRLQHLFELLRCGQPGPRTHPAPKTVWWSNHSCVIRCST